MATGPIELKDANFSSAIENGLTLVDFWAAWCGPCRMIAPSIEEIAKDYRDKIKVYKLNVDENPKTAADFGIVSIPTIIIFRDSREEDRIVGVIPKEAIAEKIDYILKR